MITCDKKDCVGCYACVNICPQKCISMEIDDEGFWYPKVNYEKCIKCGECVNVCPIIKKRTIQKDLLAYACINKDEPIRLKSSSGGIFTLLAEQIIAEGGIVFGAGFNNKFEVEHSYVEIKEDIDKFRGSKYVQSKIGITYKQAKEFLEQGRKVLYTGTPCQIGGLVSFLKRPYNNLFCIDVVCHGVPSPAVWKKYIEYREKNAQALIQKIFFRNKNKGWKQYSLLFLFKNNKEYKQVFHKDPYMKAFLKNICLRPSCYNCKFKIPYGKSDITLADFWGVENILTELDDNKGVSLIIINSNNGKNMLEEIKNKVLYKKVSLKNAILYNLTAIESVPINPKRKMFFNNLNKISFNKLVQACCSNNIILRMINKIYYKLKSLF